ncbi:MAG: FtsK/SpoIIIE domain-containing protein [Tepidisphaerales bacterium]
MDAAAQTNLKDGRVVEAVVGGRAEGEAGSADRCGPSEVVGHPRALLREALRDLQTLSATLAAEEADVVRRYEQARAAAERAAEKRTWDAGEWQRKQRAAVEAETQQRLDQLARERDAAVREAESACKRAKAAAQQTYDEQRRAIRKAMEEGAWLAESLLEGAEAAAARAIKDANDAAARTLATLTERSARHADVLGLYGMQHLVLEPPPDVSPTVVASETMDERHAQQALERELEKLAGLERTLEGLELARAFVGLKPYAIGTVVVAAGGVIGQLTTLSGVLDLVRVGIGMAAALLVSLAAGVGLKAVANRQVKAAYAPVRQAVEDARGWAELVRQLAMERIELDRKTAAARRDEELRLVKERHQPKLEQLERQLKEAVAAAESRRADALSAAERAYTAGVEAATAHRTSRLAELERRAAAELDAAQRERLAALERAERACAEGKAGLERRWNEGLERVARAMRVSSSVAGAAAVDWATFTPEVESLPSAFSPVIRFGELTVDVPSLESEAVTGQGGTAGGAGDGAQAADRPVEVASSEGAASAGRVWRFGGVLPERFTVPAVLGYGVGATPAMGNLMVDFDRGGREAALSVLRATMSRLLLGMPPGRVRLTMFDPVGLGKTFAGFMHLADYDEQLTGPRIWSETEAIERRLADLTEHMETVIQKYLRNEFDTIDAYNAQAGELAEPYRFLVVADFPTGWSAEALRKLGSVLTSGARCGVHVLLARDVRVSLERRVLEDIRAAVTPLEVEAGDAAEVLRWKDEVFGRFPLRADAEPSDAALTALCRAVGEGARRANRVEVDVAAVLPPPEQRWTWSSAEEFRVPLGRSGATRLQYLRLGRGVSQHALLAGKTGSGKSTLLHVLVTAASLWYPPDEVEFYLIDFKKGVEFKTYVDGRLPHVKAVAVESDREFGLSVLQRLDAELTRRGELFRRAGVQDISAYRAAVSVAGRADERSGGREKLPRVLLVVDEFQEFFSEDDKLAQEAAALLDRLVRQGRAFGMHVILGSQTLGGSAGLPRATLGQMAVRIALQTTEADSTLILGDGNTAARLLTRPGEAIYNDNGGLPEANSPFQVAYLNETRRDALLAEVTAAGSSRGWRYDAVVFEGNKPADLRENRDLRRLLAGEAPGPAGAGVCLIGEPVAIKPTTRVELRHQPGANVLLIGQQDEAAMATLQAAVLSLAAAEPTARFVVLEGTVEGSPLRGGLTGIATIAERLGMREPPDVIDVPYREAEDAVARMHAELKRRLELPSEEAGRSGRLVLVIYALQRYRGLRRSGDDFSFSMSGEEKKLSPDKMLAELAREGPPVGVHVLCWADTLTAVERVFERGVMREFDHRVLFQMSANDSSALIDSPAANRLGPFRGLLFSEEQGTLEKFRPFAVLAG